MNFASYLERQKQEEGEERKNAEKYWKNRLEHLPKGPDLPLATSARSGKNGVQPQDCENRKGRMGSFANAGKKYQTTPAMVLLTAYATVLERWSRNHRFLINIPFLTGKQSSRDWKT